MLDLRAARVSHDLVIESEQRAATARLVARSELGERIDIDANRWQETAATMWLPDPYGPDRVVFGRVPRVAATNP